MIFGEEVVPFSEEVILLSEELVVFIEAAVSLVTFGEGGGIVILQSTPMKSLSHRHLLSMQLPLPIQFLGQYGLPIVLQKARGSGQSIVPYSPDTNIMPALVQVTFLFPTVTLSVWFKPSPAQLNLKQKVEADTVDLEVLRVPVKHLLPTVLPYTSQEGNLALSIALGFSQS